jgi:hypothetical protein
MRTDLFPRGLPADCPQSTPADNPYNPTANARPTPGHGASLGGTTDYRSSEEENAGSARTGCNNPADGSEFFGPGADADDPRAPSRDGPQRHFAPNAIFNCGALLTATFPVTPRLLPPTSTPLFAGPILLLRLLPGPRPSLGAALGAAVELPRTVGPKKTSTACQQTLTNPRLAGRILKSRSG